jgi:hypothetical protein
MRFAVRATILIRLEARAGQWVSVADLAAHLALPEADIRFELPLMRYERQAVLQFDDRGTLTAAMAMPREEEPACA